LVFKATVAIENAIVKHSNFTEMFFIKGIILINFLLLLLEITLLSVSEMSEKKVLFYVSEVHMVTGQDWLP